MPHTPAHRSNVSTLGLTGGITILALFQPGSAAAYERYNDGCNTCHGSFFDATSPLGTTFPGGSKHAMHANIMLTQCSLCHRIGDEWNPYIGESDGTTHNPPVGCTGCHGRNYGPNVGHSGVGLRAHHAFAGITACGGCHDQDPIPLPENVAPAYYGTPDTLVDDPCNRGPDYLENWSVGDTLGSDNDGDGFYDGTDNDCCPGDIDADADVDQDDFPLFAAGLAGPDQTTPPPGVDPGHFARADLDGDEDVDLADGAEFQRNAGAICN